MASVNEKIEELQLWINEFSHQYSQNPEKVSAAEVVLAEIIDLIQDNADRASSEKRLSETYADLEQEVEERTAVLTRATTALKNQISERETAAQKLRSAYNDLEKHLQDHIAYQKKLNRRLQEQIEQQKRTQALEQEERVLTEALRDTLATMSSTLDLDKILDHILEIVGRVTPYDGANILLVESDLVRVARQKGYVDKAQESEWLEQNIPFMKLANLQQIIDIGKPIATPNTATSPMWIGFPSLDWVSSNVIAPIRSNGKILGFLSLDSATPGYFNQVHAERLQSFADQAAIAIQTARLLDRSKRAAVMAERNRLANELHDTISQTLWSISLISERLPEIWEINKEEGRHGLVTLHELAQNALAEMRSLLLELHPSSLTDSKLGDLIRHTADIIRNRTDLNITVQIENQDPIPADVHFALYRVVQEALNNVVLHASAQQVEIYYNCHKGALELSIYDDGIGFDPSKIDTGRLGLSIMNDRIKSIGGMIEIISEETGGTVIRVEWTEPPDSNT